MSDLIDRQKAIDEINKLEYPSSLVDVKRIIVELPSAEPEITRCKDCKYRDVFGYCVYGTRLAWVTESNDFCSKAERRGDEAD